MQHVIWDWNGTLFSDLHIVVEAVSETVQEMGGPPVTSDDYRRHYTRPVNLFYERLLGRPISDEEWEWLDSTFHDAYFEKVPQADLAADARQAIDLARHHGLTQSLLSMAPHDHLVPLVTWFGLHDALLRIDGVQDEAGVEKRDSMARHLAALLTHPDAPDTFEEFLVIGDAIDDASAATANGVACVLYASGSHDRHRLEATGHPVASSLTEALVIGGAIGVA